MNAPDAVIDFLRLARDVRGLQRMYRRTQDPLLKRSLPEVEASLDADLAALLADPEVAERVAVLDAAAVAVEGGVS